MKRYFFIGIGVILALSVALVAYGTWLNVSDEKQIARRMDERALSLSGARAEKRALRPKAEMDAVRLYSENMADAVALIDGRIIEWYVTKNSAVRQGDVLLRLENDQIDLKIQQATANVRRTEASLAQASNAFYRQERPRRRRRGSSLWCRRRANASPPRWTATCCLFTSGWVPMCRAARRWRWWGISTGCSFP